MRIAKMPLTKGNLFSVSIFFGADIAVETLIAFYTRIYAP